MIVIDWKKYFEDFCAAHGDPVEVDGVWLFPDGARYGAKSLRGPEWPAPQGEELMVLIKKYWQARRALIEPAHLRLDMEIKLLEEAKRLRSEDLERAMSIKEVAKNDQGHWQAHFQPVTIAALYSRLAAQRRALDLCDQQLKELEHGKRERRHDKRAARVAG